MCDLHVHVEHVHIEIAKITFGLRKKTKCKVTLCKILLQFTSYNQMILCKMYDPMAL